MEILKFKGERLDFNVADIDDFIFHLSRYKFSCRYCSGAVLDLACGVGYGSYFLSARDTVSSITACDISEEALAYARETFPNSKTTFQKQSATQLPFAECSFDTYVSLETFEHIKDVDRYLSEAYRVLKKGGHFIVSVPNRKYYRDAGISNEFHFNEMYYEEFAAKLEPLFPGVRMFYQIFPFEKLERITNRAPAREPSLIRKGISRVIPKCAKEFYKTGKYKRAYLQEGKESVSARYQLDFERLIRENRHLVEDVYKIVPIQNDEYEHSMGNFIAVCKKSA